MKNGKFVISLDFELLWGMRDKKGIKEYGDNIRGVHQVIPKLLDAFNAYQINATFSTVGFLFFDTKNELLHNLPNRLPNYENKQLSPYIGHFDMVGNSHTEDPYHFAPHLIKMIQQYPNHEIGSHTFSHYYCLESGQTIEDFRDDIKNACNAAQKYAINLTSLVFPRNQFNEQYLSVCKDLGFICYRGNEHAWIYEAKNASDESLLRRALRLLDAYINISGHNCYTDTYLASKMPIDIPASRFLRPFSRKIFFLETLRLRRIKSGMTYAAKNNLTYHLWWHPHNFGINQQENFAFLHEILKHYAHLQTQYNFQSYTMSNLAKEILNGK